ncbi:MAG: fused MFS/spermidine synthase [Armatimonadetes bacterium]|nr:fused MFS/spermidine synthase [Armatimonadota bacterium]
MASYILTIFLSAFLLFQVQPILAKVILPWFGGSAAVWTICLMFFQVVLLLGYLYAHASTRYLSPKVQSGVHVALLAVSLLFLPLMPRESWKPTGAEDPTLRIVMVLLITVGLPYLLLSSTGSLLQAWFVRQRPGLPRAESRKEMLEGTDEETAESESPREVYPYRLYAVSNAGSLLALLSYPILVEPTLPTRIQSFLWSGGYALFALLCGSIALQARTGRKVEASGPAIRGKSPGLSAGEGEAEAIPAPGWKGHLYWILLTFTSTTLLLAVTSHITQNIAPVPFLWIVPLSLYLLSFILCFGSNGWQWTWHWLVFIPLALIVLAMGASPFSESYPFVLILLLFTFGFFISCMVCHGELIRTKPHPNYLTSYYLMISLGGALGGIFVGIAAPQIFPDYYELSIAIGLVVLISLFRIYPHPVKGWRDPLWAAAGAFTVAIFYFIVSYNFISSRLYRVSERNFYGVLKVYGMSNTQTGELRRVLLHGTIKHGTQILRPRERRREATTYYGPYSGVRLALFGVEDRPRIKVGVVGLGTGTLATYSRPGDLFRFYEINPLVVRIAEEEFSYLRDRRGDAEIVMGDARLSMEREPPQQYDVLVVDAFSSDSIPVHLLTKEAFQLYFRHLKPDGILAVHTSNRYLELSKVVERIATSLGKEARIIVNKEREEKAISLAEWVLVTDRPEFFESEIMKMASQPLPPNEGLRVWTDDFSNMLRILE